MKFFFFFSFYVVQQGINFIILFSMLFLFVDMEIQVLYQKKKTQSCFCKKPRKMQLSRKDGL